MSPSPYGVPSAYSVSPSVGPVLGGTVVVVRGANLHDAPGGGEYGAFCEFAGVAVVSASFDGEGTVRCVTPASAGAGAVAVHLVSDDAVLPTSVAFTYHALLTVSRVEPPMGMLSGGTLVTLSGSGFDPSVATLARIGFETVVSARVLLSLIHI